MQCALCERVFLPMLISVDVSDPRNTKDQSVGLHLLEPAVPGSRNIQTFMSQSCLRTMCHSLFCFLSFYFLSLIFWLVWFKWSDTTQASLFWVMSSFDMIVKSKAIVYTIGGARRLTWQQQLDVVTYVRQLSSFSSHILKWNHHNITSQRAS